MLNYLSYVQRYSEIRPRTYWCEFPFYTVIENFKQHFRLGTRPEDLAHLDTIEKKAWKKHQAHLNRLERFPLEKAEYYIRLKEAHGVNTVRGLTKITGEDWSYIARILRILELSESIKDYLKENKKDPEIMKFFHIRRLTDIVRQGEERLQVARFSEYMAQLKESCLLVR